MSINGIFGGNRVTPPVKRVHCTYRWGGTMSPRSSAASATGATVYTYRTRIKFAFDCKDIQFHFANRYGVVSGSFEIANANQIQVGVTTSPVSSDQRIDAVGNFQNNADVMTIEPGCKEAIFNTGKSAKQGEEWYVYTCVKVALTTNNWPLCRMENATSYGWAANADYRYSGGPSAGDTYQFGPIAITGIPLSGSPTVWLIDSDSLGLGVQVGTEGDFAFDGGLGLVAGGFLQQSINAAGKAAMLCAQSGYQLTSDTQATRMTRTMLARYATHYAQGLKINDISIGVSSATLIAAMQAQHLVYASLGVKVYECTSTPFNAFSGAQQTVQTTVNNAIRDGSTFPNITGYIEVADVAMTARNSNTWKASYSTDGIHPNSGTGIPSLVAALTPVFATIG